jgi:G3E family GTPase
MPRIALAAQSQDSTRSALSGEYAVFFPPHTVIVVGQVERSATRPRLWRRLEDWPDGDRRSRLVFITRNLARAPVEALFAAISRLAPG